jgi:hypothetical protein
MIDVPTGIFKEFIYEFSRIFLIEVLGFECIIFPIISTIPFV